MQLKGVSTEEEIAQFLEYVEDRPYNDLRYSMDSTRLRQLGWSPQVTWQQGIDKTSEWKCAFNGFKFTFGASLRDIELWIRLIYVDCSVETGKHGCK